jgi:hypothetical protein
LKETVTKRLATLLQGQGKKADQYTLKDCDQIKTFHVFDFVTESKEGEAFQHQVQQNDFVMVSAASEG